MEEIKPKVTKVHKRASIITLGDGFYKFYINNPKKIPKN